MNISVVIPVFIENTFQLDLLNRALDSISEQSISPTEVIVSDNSIGADWQQKVKEIVNSKEIRLKYISNCNTFGAANNTNYAVERTKALLVHILHQDDYIINRRLYEEVSQIFSKNSDIWLIAQGRVGDRVLDSKFNITTKFGFNELGGPSSLFVSKENYINFNPNYRMLIDVVNFNEYFLKFGNPYILEGINIQFSIHDNQLSKNITSKEVLLELSDFIEEYNVPSSEIELTIKSIKREIHHQRLLLVASFMQRKISVFFFTKYMSLSLIKALKRKVFN
jgi:hypothetical protein